MENRTNQKICLIASLFLLLLGPALAAADVIYVDAGAAGADNGSSWPNAYNYLQDALAEANSDFNIDQIRVAQGVYTPDTYSANPNGTGDREATFQLINGVTIYGGFPTGGAELAQRDPDVYETILSGDLNGDDGPGEWENNDENSYHVVRSTGTDATAILDGFTITAGNANGGGNNNLGGGMFNSFFGSPTVTNCTFSGNSAADYGGGMCNDSDSSPTVTNCTFSANFAGGGGGMCNGNTSPMVANCTFTGNSANNGGGMYNLQNSSPTLTDCAFRDNSAEAGGGMANWNKSSPTLTNCKFSGNSAEHAGGMYNRDNSSPALTNCTFSVNSAAENGGGMENWSNSSPRLTNCRFSDNSAEWYGGGMWNEESNPTLTNCTFSRNLAGPRGGGMYNEESSAPTLTNCTLSGNSATSAGGGMYNTTSSPPTLTNCILWSNTDGGGTDESAQIDGGGTPVVNYSCIQGTWTGTGGNNIDDDPLFVDADGPDDVFGTADDNLRLSAGSPCIDAGDNDAVPSDANDLDGDGDTNEPIPWDADTHPRFLDVWTVPDTGNGTPPIVDMGAYEYANMKIKKCKAAAGSRPGRDSFTCSGKMYPTRGQIVGANQITVKIWASDDYLGSETINVKPIKLKKGKYTYRHRLGKKKKTGYITKLQLDTKKHKFSLKAKKIDLTGLSCPLFVGIEVGDYVGLGEATERIVNGRKKLIPIRFMRGYADTLRAGKRRVKPRSLDIKGGIAVADWPNPANLKTQNVTITWGTQEFTIPAGSFYTKKKWNNKYKCKRAPVPGGVIATATIDFKKCRFKLLIKKTNIDSRSGLVDFALKFDTFDETVQLNL